MPSSYEDIEAISALARIPRTPDGPDWSKASSHDLKLATNLVTSEWKFAERAAQGALAEGGGAIPYAQRHRVDEYIDDPGDEYDDDAKFAEDIRPAVRPRGGFKDTHFDDVVSNVWSWIHEAACRFDGRRAWRPYLARVIASRVADHLKKRLVAGTTNHKDDTPAQSCSRSDRAEDFELEGVFAAAAAEVAAHLKVLRRCQDKFGAGVLRALASYNSSYAEIAGRAGKSKSRVHEKGQQLLAKLPALVDATSVARIITNNKELLEKNRTILENIRIKYKDARRVVDDTDPFWLRAFERECTRPNTGQKCHRPSSLRVLDEPGRVRFRGPYVYNYHRRQQAAVRGARLELTDYLSSLVSRDPRSEFAPPNGNPPLCLPKIDGKSLRLAAYFIKRGRQKPWASAAVSGNYRWIPGPALRAVPKIRRARRSQSYEAPRGLQSDLMVAVAPFEFFSEHAAGALRLPRYESRKQEPNASVRPYRRPAQ